MASNYSQSIIDYDGQTGITGLQFTELTVGNFTAVLTKLGTLRDAMSELYLGDLVNTQVSIMHRYSSGDVPSNNDLAQRGNKWRVIVRDTSEWANPPTNTVPNYGFGKTFDFEIPTADLTLREANSDVIYTQSGGGVGAKETEIEAFVAAVEDVWLSPYGGAGTVVKIEAVTRSGG